MRYAWFILLSAISAAAVFPQTGFAAVTVNEVLFNPSSGSDTGLEKIELYNSGDAPVDLSGWDLYPDGAGYFTIPAGFVLSGKAFATVHLRTSGANDAANLYHSGASGNMGDTSGSVALFSSTNHKKETLVDFVEWSSKNAASTWEADASAAGMWVKGVPFDISALQAGNSIGLAADGVRHDAGSWQIYQMPTLGAGNSSAGESASASPAAPDGIEAQTAGISSSDGKPAGEVGRKIPPTLDVYGGEDKEVLQGAVIEFRGAASETSGASVEQGRFLWNFGDGVTAEGKSTFHIFYFPGNYNVSLNVSSGERTGADYLKITAFRPDILISEVKSGKGGFIELYNDTAHRLDLGGFLLKDGIRTFGIERNTFVDAKTAVVFANAVTGLLEIPSAVSLRDALDIQVDAGDFSGSLLTNESFERVEAGSAKFLKTKAPTPGFYAVHVPSSGGSAAVQGAATASPITTNDVQPDVSSQTGNSGENGDEKNIEKNSFSDRNSAAAFTGGVVSSWFLAASIAAGILAAAAFLFLKKRG